jgi:hypothetical protein
MGDPFMDFSDLRPADRKRSGTAERQYDFQCRADGTFLMENVLPGTYDLLIEVGPAALTRRSSSSDWIAWATRKQIEVPDETNEKKGEPLDLGILDLTQP